MSEELAPPPFRRAPDALRDRIRGELRQAPQPGHRPALLVVAAVAAAAALVAGVAGVAGIRQLQGPPRVAVAPAGTPSPTAEPSPRRSPLPGPSGTRPMTELEITADTKTCLAGTAKDDVITRAGRVRVLHAMVEPPISNSRDLASHRILLVADDAGTFSCLDGRRDSWSDHGQDDDNRLNPDAAASQDPSGFGTSTLSCPDRESASVETQVLLRIHQDGAGSARIKINSGRESVVAPVTVPVRNGWVYAGIKITGAEAWQDLSITVEVLDRDGDRLPIQPYQPGSTKLIKVLQLAVESC
ncbi:hypothetical protein [Microlunatus sp. GCM10028923]|uniref:hypothetical protein n=1 Tax=Microlunatus sp. GCM10028923 TaxID=3273400 RepID=UPI00360C15E0